ncbi:MAG TPA: phage tail protein [Candidatus Dormibacteraeota bacterium]|nr:phage tail protein [Candidatus Dormibacteraeota bacterium]
MTRARVPGLVSPHPMGELLPAMYLEDSFVQRLTTALDEVLAPVLSSLDNLHAYLDPDLAPEDFVQWLGGWVGVTLDESWPPARRRAVLAEAVGLYRVRGTAGGLAASLRLLTGCDVEIEESGGTSYSRDAYPAVPGAEGFTLLVRLRPPEGVEVNVARVEAMVAAAKPAHVVHRVEVVPFTAPAPAAADGGEEADGLQPA